MQTAMPVRLSRMIYEAERSHRPVAPLSRMQTDLSPPDAYAIQEAYAELRLRAGAQLVGRKIGCTSKAMQEFFRIDTPDFGHIFDDMVIPDGGAVSLSELIQPMVEPELAFILGADITGPGIKEDDVLAATSAIAPCMEIIDSRIQGWDITFVDTVADNGSSARCVFGALADDFHDVDLRDVSGRLTRNGELVGTALGAAVLGHPAAAVAWLANALAPYNRRLRAGDYVLSGSFTKAAPVAAGDTFAASFDTFGSVTCSFE